MRLRFATLTLVSAVFVAGCASAPPPRVEEPSLPPLPTEPEQPVQLPPRAGVYKIGEPYQVENVWYYPQEQPTYDETGLASWYGPTFYGRPTANGEIYDGNQLTAAHKTLPMPVNVRVTNLDNGRSIVVRVNDRGPFARGRIIDLSRHAAEQLDMIRAGVARVRVTYLGRAELGGKVPPPETPPEIASAVPAAPAGRVDTAQLGAVPGAGVAPPRPSAALPVPVPSDAAAMVSTEPTGRIEQVPVPATNRLYVQVGAFSNIANARRLMNSLGGGLQISTLQRGGQTLYRVRTGPLASVEEADAALTRINSQAGGGDARIVVDQ
jgi:rare lipoprotein A